MMYFGLQLILTSSERGTRLIKEYGYKAIYDKKKRKLRFFVRLCCCCCLKRIKKFLKWCKGELELSDSTYFKRIKRRRHTQLLTKRSVITNKLDMEVIKIKEYGIPYYMDEHRKPIKNPNGMKLAAALENYHSKLEIEQREHVAQILKYNKLYYKYFKTVDKALKKYNKSNSVNAVEQIKHIIN